MKPIAHETLLSALNWRYATKRFDRTRKIADADLEVLENALQLAPSSYGLQPFRFVVIRNPDLRKKLTPVSWNQPQIEECSHLVVVTARKSIDADYVDHFLKCISTTRGVSAESLDGFRKMMIGALVEGPQSKVSGFWSQRQAYLSIGFLLEAAALLGIDACPMEGFDPAAYDRILDLEKSEYGAVAIVALGYRSAEDAYQKLKKVRLPKNEIIQER